MAEGSREAFGKMFGNKIRCQARYAEKVTVLYSSEKSRRCRTAKTCMMVRGQILFGLVKS